MSSENFKSEGKARRVPGRLDRLDRWPGRCRLGGSVGVGDGDAPESPPGNVAGPLAFRPIRIPERIVFIGITVGPAIDGDSLDVACRIEPAGRQDTRQLVSDIALKGFE